MNQEERRGRERERENGHLTFGTSQLGRVRAYVWVA